MALNGNELLLVTGVQSNGQPSGEQFQTTTAAVAALASSETSFTTNNVTSITGTTLTGAFMLGDQIVRTGPSANFSDTTDTAAAIIAAFPGGVAAGSNYLNIKNATAFTMTLLAGTNVTLPLTIIIPPFAVGEYVVTPTSATAVTLTHIETNPITIGQNTTNPTIVALTTAGAGTITAANFAGGLTARSGPSGLFTDTTDTAAAIIAACANLVGKIGTSFIYYYQNSSSFVATVTGGTGVTVSGVTIVPPNTIAAYLITYTAAATLTMVGLGVTQSISTAVNIAGSSTGTTIVQAAAAASGTLTLPPVTGTLAVSNPTPQAAGATLAVTTAMVNAAILLNTASGSVVTLPAATGTGNVYKFFVTTTATSNKHAILAASSSDFLNGVAVGHIAAGTTLSFSAAAATAHSIQMPFAGTQPSGGFIGDWFEFTDVATNLWDVKGMYQSGTTSTTPFSAATS